MLPFFLQYTALPCEDNVTLTKKDIFPVIRKIVSSLCKIHFQTVLQYMEPCKTYIMLAGICNLEVMCNCNVM